MRAIFGMQQFRQPPIKFVISSGFVTEQYVVTKVSAFIIRTSICISWAKGKK